MNRLIYHLHCGLIWAEGSTSSIISFRWRLCALTHCAHWRHLANMIEPSVCCSDMALCQLSLTTCSCYYAVKQFMWFQWEVEVTVVCVCVRVCLVWSQSRGHSAEAATKDIQERSIGSDSVLLLLLILLLVTFCVSRRRRKMYCGHARLCVCVSVCLSVCPRPYAHTTVRTRM